MGQHDALRTGDLAGALLTSGWTTSKKSNLFIRLTGSRVLQAPQRKRSAPGADDGQDLPAV